MAPISLFLSLAYCTAVAVAQLNSSSLEKHPNTLALKYPFNPVKAAYWTALPHHRRTPFAVGLSYLLPNVVLTTTERDRLYPWLMCCVLKVSPDGGSAYLAYLDDSETDVHIQQVDPTNFNAVGATMTVKRAKEGTCSHFIPTTFYL
jgi:hypothetical protein